MIYMAHEFHYIINPVFDFSVANFRGNGDGGMGISSCDHFPLTKETIQKGKSENPLNRQNFPNLAFPFSFFLPD